MRVLGQIFIAFVIVALIAGAAAYLIIPKQDNARHASPPSIIFTHSAKTKIRPWTSYNSENRNPIMSYVVDKADFQDYTIHVFKIDLAVDSPFRSLFTFDSLNYSSENLGGYGEAFDLYTFRHSDRPSYPVQHVYLSMTGDTIQTVASTDSMVCYYAKLGTLAIHYSHNGPSDIWINGYDDIDTRRYFAIAFLKMNKAIYFAIMHRNNGPLDPQLLYSFLKK